MFILSVEFETFIRSDEVFNRALIVSSEYLTRSVKSVFTTETESKLEEIDANLRFRVFKIAARAGNK